MRRTPGTPAETLVLLGHVRRRIDPPGEPQPRKGLDDLDSADDMAIDLRQSAAAIHSSRRAMPPTVAEHRSVGT